ncbi:MAG: hypothetical protein IPM16_14290 [Chloroflexi bacterium]|nr:hypothetical protein [Chloroflexota bacterium]
MTPLVVTWDDESQTVVRLDVQRDYTWPEFDAGVAHVSDLVAAQSHRCDIIANLGKASAETHGLSAVQRALSALAGLPDNVGLIVLVVPPLAGMLLAAARRIEPKIGGRVHTASTIDKARELIRRERAGNR